MKTARDELNDALNNLTKTTDMLDKTVDSLESITSKIARGARAWARKMPCIPTAKEDNRLKTNR
jgi:ABC-type transporter Mla subunit MlaD